MEEKISINLLPQEFLYEEVKKGKFYKVQTVGIFVVLFMVLLTVVTISLRILQSNRLKNLQLQTSEAEAKVSSFSSKQASLILLKNRLDAINKYLGSPSKQAEMYDLVSSLLPPALTVSAVSVEPDGTVLISALASDSDVLERLFTDLLDKEKNEGKISKVSIEALNRGRDGIFRLSFKVERAK